MSTNIQEGKIQIIENCSYNEEVHNAGKGRTSCEKLWQNNCFSLFLIQAWATLYTHHVLNK